MLFTVNMFAKMATSRCLTRWLWLDEEELLWLLIRNMETILSIKIY